MRKDDLLHYQRSLHSQLSELLDGGGKVVQRMSAQAAEDLADPNDRASLETERGYDLRLRDRDRKLIGKIQAALQRIEEGTFGICESCGGRISPARLRARPVTTLCIDCKTDAERLER